MPIFKNPAKDAKKIQKAVDYRVLKAAWDSYAKLNARKGSKTNRSATPAWFALFAIQNYKGDFRKFSKEELHLLIALKNVNNAYNEIISSLDSANSDTELARHILNTNPILEEIVPQDLYSLGKINGYIASSIKQYQSLLVDFNKKHQKNIDSAIEDLQNKT